MDDASTDEDKPESPGFSIVSTAETFGPPTKGSEM